MHEASLIIALLEVMVCVRHRSSGGIPFLSKLNYEDFTLIEMTISQNAWTSFIFVKAGVFIYSLPSYQAQAQLCGSDQKDNFSQDLTNFEPICLSKYLF